MSSPEALHYRIRRLRNLTGRSAVLRLLTPTADRFLDVHRLDQPLERPSFAIIEELLALKQRIRIASQADPSDVEQSALSLQLPKVQRAEAFLFQERGTRDLHIGYPFIGGKLRDERLFRATHAPTTLPLL